MKIEDYLERVGLKERPAPDLAGLRAVHRAHMFAIPYENLDVQLARPVTTSPEAAWEKIVKRRRGGWCYEMNGTLGTALALLGFKTTRLAGAVMREVTGEKATSNHLVIRVDLPEGIYLADSGFGEGSIDPVKVVPGRFKSNGFIFDITEEEGDWLRVHKYVPNARRSFDVQLRPADEDAFASRCNELQTAADSQFVQNLMCYRHFDGGYYNLLGRVFREVRSTADEKVFDIKERLIEDADDLVATLKQYLAADVPEAASLWPKIAARHEVVMREKEREKEKIKEEQLSG